MGESKMRKIITLGIMLLFLGMTISSSTGLYLEKQSIKPLSSGNTLYVGGNGTGNYTKIQDAIDDASNGDIVYVYDDGSPYYENVRVNKSINLVGEDRNTTRITAPHHYTGAVSLQAPNITLTGFKLTHNNSNAGILILSAFNNVHHNIITSNYCGIEVSDKDSNGNQIHHNIIKNCEDADGIRLIFTSYQKVYENTISADCTGIDMFGASNNSIYRNHIISNHWGIYFTQASNNNRIFKNYISKNSGCGLAFWWGNPSENLVYENEIVNNTRYGIRMYYEGNDNFIFHNNFINNSYGHAVDECNNTWDNGYPSGGNYWDDYNGTDRDGDGIGDTPYNISGGDNRDRYPLMEPYGMTELSLNFIDGLFKISGYIKNIGNKTAFNVQWSITVEGGFVLIGKESSGTILKPLLPDEEVTITTGIILGFGKIMITVAAWADNAPLVSKSTSGFLLLFFII